MLTSITATIRSDYVLISEYVEPIVPRLLQAISVRKTELEDIVKSHAVLSTLTSRLTGTN